ncbi:MAG: ABC transporter permease subunit [Oscillochloridaceae bacterium]|nr:ABC transporter permease subunit [Chloroflexaceae bacterium]MDW8389606.1 ABC transporter permease subunit [Oscillochloridaceae bacterium]
MRGLAAGINRGAASAASMGGGQWRAGAGAALLAAPLLLTLFALLIWPLVVLALRSLGAPEGVGVSVTTYLAVLREPRYWRVLGNTALLALVSTIGALALCTPAAIYLEWQRGRLSRALAVLLTIPLSLPGIVIGFFVILLFGRTGVVVSLAGALLGERPPPLAYNFWGLLVGYIYFQIPRVVLVLRGAVATIEPDTLDAARTLGAPPWRVYTAVILPVLRPALLGAASLSMATAFGAFGTAATLSRGYRVVPLEIAAAFTERFEPQLAATLSLLLALFTTVLLWTMGRLGAPRRTEQRR